MAKTPEFDFRDNYSQNYIINGNMDYWQRGTTFSTPASGAYTADRWRVGYDGTIGTFTVSAQSFTLGQTAVPGEPTSFLRWNHTAAGSGSTSRALSQRIEGVRTLAGKTITASVYLKADTTRTMSISMFQNFGTSGSPSANVPIAAQNITLTTAWQKFTLTFVVPSISGKTLGTDNNDYLSLTLNLPINTTMTIDVSQVMVNEGTEAGNFSYYNNNVAAELMACKRYYQKSFDLLVTPANSGNTTSILDSGNAIAFNHHNSLIGVFVQFQVVMRNAPILTRYGTSNGRWIYYGINNAAVVEANVSTDFLTSRTNGFTFAQQATAAMVTIQGHFTAEAEL